jgi:uncharacterized protein (TIGR00288 family)
MQLMSDIENNLAVFVDLENLALGFENQKSDSAKGSQKRNRKVLFDIHKVLERLVEKGKIIAKKAYADWGAFPQYKKPLHEAAIELIEIPRRAMTGKNSADIRMVVDAMDLCYSKDHINMFVVISGDSDFSPLVSKLKENGKHVIGIGMRNSSSELLVSNCDEFIFYEDIAPSGPRKIGIVTKDLPKAKRQVFQLLVESVAALNRENKGILYSSLVKQTMQRKRPSFNESFYGYDSFTDLLKDAKKHGIVQLRRDERSGTWVVASLEKE